MPTGTGEIPTVRQTILDTARQYVSKDRNLDYDSPEKNFEMIAELWNAYLNGKGMEAENIQPHDVAVLMILVKVARISTSPSKMDHWIDIAGYAACGGECVT